MRRQPGAWMQLPVDHRILEVLEDSGLTLSPQVIAINIDYSRKYVNSRLSELVDKGLVDKVDRGYYEISEDGIGYLAGDIDASDLSD